MAVHPFSAIQRREFLKAAGAVTVLGFTHQAMAAHGGSVAILIDAPDPRHSSEPVKRGAERLRTALAGKGVHCRMAQSADEAKGAASYIVVAASGSDLAKGFPQSAAEMTAESIRLAPGNYQSAPAILVSGIDHLGYIYRLLELAERV